MQKQSETGTERPNGDQKKIDLSGAQVAGSAAATVVTAFLASSMGVYGTIIGAGVVSVGATAGGAVFQHFFRRTGEQIKEVAVHGPKATKVTKVLPALNRTDRVTADAPVALATEAQAAEAPEAQTAVGAGATRTLQATQLMPQADETALLGAGGPGDGDKAADAPADAGYGDATVHGSAKRGLRWKRIALTAAGVFAIGLGAITAVEAIAGESMSDVWGRGNGGGTSVGSIFGGGGKSTDDSVDPQQEKGADQDKKQDDQPTGGATSGTGGEDDGATKPSPGATEDGQSGQGGGQKPDPGSSTDPGGSGGQDDGGKESPATTPTPTTPDDGAATPESGSGAGDVQPKTESSAG
ncbi:hypothetical protein G5C51_22785 [Streptomyces sp. A7024]|uniref:Uncharacterized protein n=1 Tax=Streptomyces coryli TaxID=1128680 RepID=A0A6G4U5Z0_9ACTN|nr:hypothetical protein [Streptomyces coryli]NGN66717.1 hypothetical protein [Streptomyces coryli]